MPGSQGHDRVNGLTGEGTLAVHMIPRLVEAAQALGIEHTLMDAGAPDHNRATAYHAQPLQIPGVHYLGLTPEQTHESYGYLADAGRATRRRSARLASDTHITDLHIETAHALGLDCPFSLFIYSTNSGHTQPAIERLEDLHRRLPNEIRLGYSVLPHEQYLRDDIGRAAQLPVTMRERGLLESSILLDNQSAIVQHHGRPFQDRLAAHGLASLLAAIWHFPNQRGPADVAHALGRYCSLIGMSFGLRHLVVSAEVPWWRPIRSAFGWSPKGRASIDDLVIQTIAAATDALTDPSWRALDEQIEPGKQAFAIFTVPVRQDDAEVRRPLVAEVEHWFDNHYPHVTLLWASGNGTPLPDLAATSAYWVQASLLYPMRDCPSAIRTIQQGPVLTRLTHRDGQHMHSQPPRHRQESSSRLRRAH